MGLQRYIVDLLDYWRDIILLFIGIALVVIACVLPFLLKTLNIFSPLALLFPLICSPVLMLLALIPWSFMRSFPVGTKVMPRVWLPQEPAQQVDYSLFYQRHRVIVLVAAIANLLFFVCLLGYLLWIAQVDAWDRVTQDTSFLIWLFWVITNGLIIVGFCISEVFKDSES